VPFRYRINLAREEVNRRAAREGLLRAVAISLCVLAGLLAVTFGVYFVREGQGEINAGKTRMLLKVMRDQGVQKRQAEDLHKHSRQVTMRLTALERILEETVSWPSVLTALGRACKGGRVRLVRVEAERSDGRTLLEVHGLCPGSNPTDTLKEFLARLTREERFESGTVVHVGDQPKGLAEFTVKVLLKPLLPPRPSVAKTGKPEKKEDA